LPTGEIKTEFLVRIVQTVEVERNSKAVMPERTRDAVSKGLPDGCFLFRGGCTLVIDMDKRDIKFLITKSVCDQSRIDRQCDYTAETESSALAAMYGLADQTTRSPFAAMHRGMR
jgi:hypothetical protein